MDSGMSDTREDAAVGGFTTETDESLPHSVSLPNMEELDTDPDNSVPDTPGKYCCTPRLTRTKWWTDISGKAHTHCDWDRNKSLKKKGFHSCHP